MKLFSKIQDWNQRRKEKAADLQRKLILEEINVSLKDGKIFILVCGTAVYQAEETETVGHLLEKVSETAELALKYKGL